MSENEASELRALLEEVQDSREKIEKFFSKYRPFDFQNAAEDRLNEYKLLLATGRQKLRKFQSHLRNCLILGELRDFGKEDIGDYRNEETLIDSRTKFFYGSLMKIAMKAVSPDVQRILEESINDKKSWDEFLGIAPDRNVFDVDLFHSILDELDMIDQYEFEDRHLDLVPIFVAEEIPENLLPIARTISSHYKLGQWATVIIYCRVLLEDILKYIDPSKRYYEISNPKWLDSVGKKLLRKNELGQLKIAKQSMYDANDILHEARESTKEDALRKLKASFEIAELLLGRQKEL